MDNVVDVELQDNEKFNDIEHLHVKLFEDNTIDVRAGEIVAITGISTLIRKAKVAASISQYFIQSL